MGEARLVCETAAYEAKVAARELKFQETGKKPGGQEPSPPRKGLTTRINPISLTLNPA
jgi:hypothetical protein